MSKTDLNHWAQSVHGLLEPPGCETVFVSHPSRMDRCCTIGIVHEHRFAFYYWACFAHKDKGSRPILVTLDSHNDVGVSDDFVPEELDSLNLGNTTTLGLFTWLRLSRLNDGHILPSLYLDFFSDVYVLLNRNSQSDFADGTRQQKGRSGTIHTVRYFFDEYELKNALPLDCDVFLDIDLDYFSDPNMQSGDVVGSEIQWPETLIRKFVGNPRGIVQSVLPTVVGMTIALEPAYCGGLLNCQHALGVVNKVLFNDTLCTDNTRWRKRRRLGK